MTPYPTGTVTFLFTDIEGSTRLAREHPDTWETARSRHHEILQEAVVSNQGVVFQIIGDAFCTAFHRAGDALKAAYQAQTHLQELNGEQTPIRVRMGIHTGEAEALDGEYHGYLTLSLTQRLMSAGHGGQILVSGATENLLRSQLSKEVSLRDLGNQTVRDVPELVRVFQVTAPLLQVDFPALRTTPSHPNNLPTQLTSFVGREKELEEIQRLLANTHMLTLIGPGGTGKTRISIQVASALLDRFPDGLWLVELAPILDPLLVPRLTAMTMGLRDEPQRPVIEMLCDYLREKKMLLILDNCEHLVDACARMADKILHAAPFVRILASSREALGIGGEVTYRVPSLGLPDVNHLPALESLSQYEAVKLFIDRARSAIPSFSVTNENAPAVAQICHRLDGIPLAIELAAAKIRVLGVEQIAKRLDDRFRLLTGGSRTALERHQTLRAAIDWSYNILPSSEQIFFRRLSVFVGGWTLEAAESICGSGLEADVLDLLEQLINKSLVMMESGEGQTRYHMLETMRQYAAEKLVETGESDLLHDRHMFYFIELAEAAEPHLIRPEQLEWLARLEADYENLREALEWALSKDSAEPSLRLCAALGQFWSVRSYWLEGTKWLGQALVKPAGQSKTEKIFRARALYKDANLAEHLDDIPRIRASAEQSLRLAQETSDKREIAIAKFYIGLALWRQNEYDNALVLSEQSFTDFQEMNDLYWKMRSYKLLSSILFAQGKITAKERLERSFEYSGAAGERVELAEALIGLGLYHYLISQLDKAGKYAEEGRELLKQIGSNIYQPEILLAELAWVNGDYKEARAEYTDLQARLRLLGERNVRSGVILHLGSIALEESDFDQAHSLLKESLTTAQELQNYFFVVEASFEIGNLYYLEGNLDEFKQRYREGIAMAKKLLLADKFYNLFLTLRPLHRQAAHRMVSILGAIEHCQRETEFPDVPIFKRFYDRAESFTRQELNPEEFELAFAQGQTLSLDNALDLVLKTVEEM
jgi:predicted ATPase/class 3 adenylate cyclase